MGELAQVDLPAALRRVQRRLERWRQRRSPRARIPEELWREAVALASAYGINRIARSLRLDYYSLKKRVAAGSPSDRDLAGAAGPGRRRAARSRSGEPTMAASRAGEGFPPGTRSGKRLPAAAGSGPCVAEFVEFLPGGIPGSGGECMIEVADGSGVKMRIRLPGGALPDVAALVGVFRQGRR